MLTVPVYNPRLQPARQRGLECPAAPDEGIVASPPCQAAFDPPCGAGGFIGAARNPLVGKIHIVVMRFISTPNSRRGLSSVPVGGGNGLLRVQCNRAFRKPKVSRIKSVGNCACCFDKSRLPGRRVRR